MENTYPTLETERLRLRLPETADAEEYHRLLCLDQMTELTNIPRSPTEKRSQRFVSWMAKLFSKGSGCGWIISLKHPDKPIGAIRINQINKKARFGEIGYELSPEYWNQGLMTEAVASVTECGHSTFKLNRIEAWTIEGNVASETVLLKNNFKYEGLLRQRLYLRGEICDVKMFSHLNNSNADKIN